jgi:predicted enzyme related to lactoylglutathione lyase
MKIRGTDFVRYHVSDLATAVAFYRDVLGLPLEICSEEYHWAGFDCGNVTLALPAGESVVESGTGARIALAVDDIDLACAELGAKGARILQSPQDHGVCRALEVLDPDGNVILLHRRADGTFGRNASPS